MTSLYLVALCSNILLISKKFFNDLERLISKCTWKFLGYIELNPTQKRTANSLKHLGLVRLTNKPTLAYPDFQNPFNLSTEASNFAANAILFQRLIPSDKPIAYASRTLSSAENSEYPAEQRIVNILHLR